MDHSAERALQQLIQAHTVPFAFVFLDTPDLLLVTNPLLPPREDRQQIFEQIVADLLDQRQRVEPVPPALSSVEAIAFFDVNETLLFVHQKADAARQGRMMVALLHDGRNRYLEYLDLVNQGEESKCRAGGKQDTPDKTS